MLPQSVIVTTSFEEQLEPFLKEGDYSGVAILVDENTEEYCLPLLQPSVVNPVVIRIPSGEENKNLETCKEIWNSMTEAELDRSSLLLNLGGGVICDMGGFCATAFKRGIDFINIPTTLLAQVDASVGGKTGVNFKTLKNQVGVFSEPIATIINTNFLSTLNQRQLRSGFAEVVKHSIIADKNHFDFLSKISLDEAPWSEVIETSIGIKNSFVEKDPFEEDMRKALNFGHTLGHAIESYSIGKEKPILHGEAIAIGMLCESYISHIKLGMTESSLMAIKSLIFSNLELPELPIEAHEELLRLIRNDKKNKSGKVLMSLSPSIGQVKVNVEVSDQEIIESLAFYKSARN